MQNMYTLFVCCVHKNMQNLHYITKFTACYTKYTKIEAVFVIFSRLTKKWWLSLEILLHIFSSSGFKKCNRIVIIKVKISKKWNCIDDLCFSEGLCCLQVLTSITTESPESEKLQRKVWNYRLLSLLKLLGYCSQPNKTPVKWRGFLTTWNFNHCVQHTVMLTMEQMCFYSIV